MSLPDEFRRAVEMFFRQRAKGFEHTDSPTLSYAEVTENFRQLARINKFFLFADPFLRLLPEWLGPDHCRSLSILDLGAGDGSLGKALQSQAGLRRWQWKVTSLDFNSHSLRLNPQGRNVRASVLSLPFPPDSFDVVIASQMTHHLQTDADVVQHFREAWRVARTAIFLNDIHRNVALYGFLWVLLHALGSSTHFLQDGLLSIRRGWRLPEWRDLARQAGIPLPGVSLYFGSRVILQARKETPSPTSPTPEPRAP